MTENGHPARARVLVSRSAAGGPFRSHLTGLIRTDAGGRFHISGRLSTHQVVRFRAHASADRRDISKPSCGKDVNGTLCVHKTLALWEGLERRHDPTVRDLLTAALQLLSL